MLTIGVLASHAGTTAQAVIDACAEGSLEGRVSVVISNNTDAGLGGCRAGWMPGWVDAGLGGCCGSRRSTGQHQGVGQFVGDGLGTDGDRGFAGGGASGEFADGGSGAAVGQFGDP
jgi:hypothetical protein